MREDAYTVEFAIPEVLKDGNLNVDLAVVGVFGYACDVEFATLELLKDGNLDVDLAVIEVFGDAFDVELAIPELFEDDNFDVDLAVVEIVEDVTLGFDSVDAGRLDVAVGLGGLDGFCETFGNGFPFGAALHAFLFFLMQPSLLPTSSGALINDSKPLKFQPGTPQRSPIQLL